MGEEITLSAQCRRRRLRSLSNSRRAASGRHVADFQDPSQEWRRLFSELLGTFFLVLVAAGGGMMGQAFPNTISRTAAVVAPGADGAGDHPVHGQGLRRPSQPGGEYRVRAARGLPVAAGTRLHRGSVGRGALWPRGSCRPSSDVSASYGSNYPAPGYSASDAFVMETVLTFGWSASSSAPRPARRTWASSARSGVGGYIALAGLWGSPISGASMNPARTFGPDAGQRRFHLVLGLCRRPARSAPRWPSASPSCSRAAAAVGRLGRRAGRAVHPRPRTATRPERRPWRCLDMS